LYAAFPAPVNAEPDFRESPKFIKEAGRIEALIDAAVNQEKPCKCDVRKLLKLLQELLENEEQLKRKNADISQSLAKTRQKLLEAAEQESRSGETSFTKTVAWSALNLLMDVTLDQADKAFDFGTKSLNELGAGIRTVKGGARVAGKFLGKGASKGGQIGKVAYDYLGSAGANADRLKKYPELNAAEASIRKMGENQAESMENKRLEQLIWNKILGSPGCLEALNTQCSLADIEYVSKRGVLNQLDKVSYPYLNFVIHDIERVADTYGYRAFPGKDYEEKGFSHAELKKYVMPKLELYQYFDEQAYKYNAVAGQSIAAAGRASEKCNTCKMLKALKGLSDLKSEIDVLENDWKGVYVGTIRGVIGSHKALAKMWAAKGSPAKITSHPLYQLEGLALSLVSVTTPVGTAMSAAAAVSEISQAVGDLVFKAPVTEDIKRQAKLMKVFADSLNNSIGALADTSNRIEKARADLIRRLFDCNKIKTCPKEKPVSYPAPQYRSVERHPVAIPGHGSLSPGAKKAAGVLIPGYGGPGADCVSLANELRSLEKQRKQLNQRAARLHKEWVKAYNRIPKLEKEIEELAGYIKDASQLMGWGYYVGGTKEGVLAKLKEWKEEKGRKESLAHQLRIREAKLRYQKEQLSKRERNLHNHIAQVRRALDNCGKKAPEPNQPPAKQAKTTPVQPVRKGVELDPTFAGCWFGGERLVLQVKGHKAEATYNRIEIEEDREVKENYQLEFQGSFEKPWISLAHRYSADLIKKMFPNPYYDPTKESKQDAYDAALSLNPEMRYRLKLSKYASSEPPWNTMRRLTGTYARFVPYHEDFSGYSETENPESPAELDPEIPTPVEIRITKNDFQTPLQKVGSGDRIWIVARTNESCEVAKSKIYLQLAGYILPSLSKSPKAYMSCTPLTSVVELTETGIGSKVFHSPSEGIPVRCSTPNVQTEPGGVSLDPIFFQDNTYQEYVNERRTGKLRNPRDPDFPRAHFVLYPK
jgi:phage shock protein A